MEIPWTRFHATVDTFIELNEPSQLFFLLYANQANWNVHRFRLRSQIVGVLYESLHK